MLKYILVIFAIFSTNKILAQNIEDCTNVPFEYTETNSVINSQSKNTLINNKLNGNSACYMFYGIRKNNHESKQVTINNVAYELVSDQIWLCGANFQLKKYVCWVAINSTNGTFHSFDFESQEQPKGDCEDIKPYATFHNIAAYGSTDQTYAFQIVRGKSACHLFKELAKKHTIQSRQCTETSTTQYIDTENWVCYYSKDFVTTYVCEVAVNILSKKLYHLLNIVPCGEETLVGVRTGDQQVE